tara:strand:+ start:265 stop:534 length:270 start_codon:yes stop_codon:yes gene_type:complete
MQNINGEYWDNYRKLKDLVVKIGQEMAENDLPEDLNSPKSDEDSLNVNNFADRIYRLGCEITDVSEKLMVGRGVQENYIDKLDEEPVYE